MGNNGLDTSTKHDEYLQKNNGNQDKDECKVGFNVLENVEFIIDFSGAKHVENLKPHK
jgi:hypothetical protein